MRFEVLEKAALEHDFAIVSAEADRLKKTRGIAKAEKDTLEKFKVIALLKSDSPQETLASTEGRSWLSFERAYALYKLNRFKDCLNVLRPHLDKKNRETKVIVLAAQTYYRLEQYDRAAELFTSVPRDLEVSANVVASLVRSGNVQEALAEIAKSQENSFELVYNMACCQVANGELDEAFETLQKAEGLCRKTLGEEGYSPSEINDEVQIIKAQTNGRATEAETLYKKIQSSRPSDLSVRAVTAANLIAINGDRNLSASLDSAKSLASQELRTKLTSSQRHSMDITRCLLLVRMKKFEECSKIVSKIKGDFVRTESTVVVKGALGIAQESFDQAHNLLRAAGDKYNYLTVRLTLIQSLINQDQLAEAVGEMKKCTEMLIYPGFLATMLAAYEKLHHKSPKKGYNLKAGAAVLASLALWTEEKRQANKQAFLELVTNCGNALSERFSDHETAFKCFELLNNNTGINMARMCYEASFFDTVLAEKYEKLLPTIHIDEDEMEKALLEPIREASALATKSKKKTARRQRHMVAKPTGKPDPERWIPVRDRSTYKKGRKKAVKGSQGSGSGLSGEVVEAVSPSEAPAAKPSSGRKQPAPRKKKKNRK